MTEIFKEQGRTEEISLEAKTPTQKLGLVADTLDETLFQDLNTLKLALHSLETSEELTDRPDFQVLQERLTRATSNLRATQRVCRQRSRRVPIDHRYKDKPIIALDQVPLPKNPFLK